jgi:hypothetical protein
VKSAGSGSGPRRGAALLAGVGAAFVAGVDLARWIRPGLLTDPDPAWALPRLLLGLVVATGAAAAGTLVASAILLAARRLPESLPLAELPLRRAGLVASAVASIALGALARFASLQTLPPSLWIDDVSLIAPALELTGRPGDFADAIRPAPFGVHKTYGSVGVLYLELYRASLKLFGVTVFGVRFPSAAAGSLSVVTALLLGRALLPRGGGTLAALVMAGLRWSLLMSRWAWNAIVLAPVLDIAALLLLRSRRRESLVLALAAGVVAGAAAHIYLAAWIGAGALLLLAAWPLGGAAPRRPRVAPALLFAAGFALAAAPIFLFREGRTAPYFARASDHSVLAEIRYTHSPLPAFAAAADSLAAPWFKSDPYAHHDLPGRTRLGWILGLPVALALARSLLRPGEEASAYLLSQAGAALAASVAGGHAGVPNGYRFCYLAESVAVATAAGVLFLLGLVPAPRRRIAAIVAVGLLSVSGVLGVRDAILVWPQRRETFDGFHGQDTLIARAALAWERYGSVAISPGLGHSPITIEGIRRYRLEPYPLQAVSAAGRDSRSFRIESPTTPPLEGERPVARLKDAWGREWALVLGRRIPTRGSSGL